jgi:recombinational DNA repair protein (RecF pathway)
MIITSTKTALTLEGLCLKSTAYGEFDKICTYYTQAKGLIQVLAKGCRRSNSKLGSASQLLLFNSISVVPPAKPDGLYILRQIQNINAFEAVQNQLELLACSQVLLESLYALGSGTEAQADSVLRHLQAVLLFYNQLALLALSPNALLEEGLWQILLFQARLLQWQGQWPAWQPIAVNNALPSVVFYDAHQHCLTLKKSAISASHLNSVTPVSASTIEVFSQLSNALLTDGSSTLVSLPEPTNLAMLQKAFRFMQFYWQSVSQKALKSTKLLEQLF